MHGAVGREWLQWLTANADTLKACIRELSAGLLLSLKVPETAGGGVSRRGSLAPVGAADESWRPPAGLTGWAGGEAERRPPASASNARLAGRVAP